MKNLKCPNADCPSRRNGREAGITKHGFYKTRSGKRRRYLCRAGIMTFSSTQGTASYRLQHRRALCDEIASLSVEGVNKAAISRVKGIGWNTVHRRLERAGELCLRFNEKRLHGFELKELQADEIRVFVGEKEEVVRIFEGIEVGTRLWPATVVGRRSYRNTLELFRDVLDRSVSSEKPLIVTDGFEFYGRVVDEVFGVNCLYAQVLKTWRDNRVVKGERRKEIGSQSEFDRALLDSEDSETLNTSFMERLNLTRRTACHARRVEELRSQLEIVRCYYNFLRPHRALKFGWEMRTPAMQAGLAQCRLSFREIGLRLISVMGDYRFGAWTMIRIVDGLRFV